MKIIVIGAGASGLFYSLVAGNKGHEVIVLESNEKAGKKLYLTGKGRCNITNKSEVKDCIKNVISNPKFLFSAFSKWNPEDTIAFFNDRGCPLKVERGNRVFPESDHSSDVINCLLKECRKAGVTIKYGETAKNIKRKEGKFVAETRTALYEGDALVIATGGMSYPQTGSTGDGYRFAKEFGHGIKRPTAALCPILIEENVTRDMLDFTLKNVALTAWNDDFKKTIFGDLEFLPGAITGPITLTMSSYINRLGKMNLSLDFKPALDEQKLDQRLLREISAAPNKDVKYLLSKLLPSELFAFFLSGSSLDESKQLNSLTKEERRALLLRLKQFPLTFKGLDSIEKGIITSGGVAVNEIDSKNMMSKIVPNLYFVGEVIDVDALTGGFNLQIALSTAFAAASSL